MSRIEQTVLPAITAVAVRHTVPLVELPAFFAQAYHEMDEAVRAAGASYAGPPFARYFSAPPGPVDVEVCMPVDRAVAARGRVRVVQLESTPAVQAMHVGPYDAIGPVYAEVGRFVGDNGLEPADAPREVYLTDPEQQPDPARWQTLVVQPTRPRASDARAAP